MGLGIAAIYYRWISLPPPKTFARYWDFSLPSAEVRPTTISKYNTALQLALIGATPDAITLALFTSGYLNVKPAGVQIDYYMTPVAPGVPYFGIGVQNANIAGFGYGAFGNSYPGT